MSSHGLPSIVGTAFCWDPHPNLLESKRSDRNHVHPEPNGRFCTPKELEEAKRTPTFSRPPDWISELAAAPLNLGTEWPGPGCW